MESGRIHVKAILVRMVGHVNPPMATNMPCAPANLVTQASSVTYKSKVFTRNFEKIDNFKLNKSRGILVDMVQFAIKNV